MSNVIFFLQKNVWGKGKGEKFERGKMPFVQKSFVPSTPTYTPVCSCTLYTYIPIHTHTPLLKRIYIYTYIYIHTHDHTTAPPGPEQ